MSDIEENDDGLIQWWNIKGFPNYQVNRSGDIRNKHRRTRVSPSYTRDGHVSVNLYKDGIRSNHSVAKLVLLTFFTRPPDRVNVTYIPMHIDGDVTNCSAMNLKWAPRVEVLAAARARRRGY